MTDASPTTTAATAATRALRITNPVVQGPFGAGLSSVGLTAAVSNAGGLGSFGANHLPPEAITAVVAELRARTDQPFNINLWVPLTGDTGQASLTEAEHARHLALLRPYYDELDLPAPPLSPSYGQRFVDQVEALLQARPPVISFVFGVPPAELLTEARSRGITTIATATTVEEAGVLEAAGVEVIVASGSDAGGHRGAFLRPPEESLVGTFSLVPQVVDAVNVPVLAAGGIADARGVAAAFALGAAGVQVGTAFLVTEESTAPAVHKATLTGPNAATTVLTSAFTGRTARAVPNRLTRALEPLSSHLAPYPAQSALTAPLRQAATERALPDYLNLWAGQAAALTRARPAAEVLGELLRGAPTTTRPQATA